PFELASADVGDLEEMVHTAGFFRAKSAALLGMSRALVDRFGGEVPPRMEDLVTLPGVGRKTANVVLSVGFGLPGLPVDTHVTRLSQLIGLTEETKPERIDVDLDAELPRREWGPFSLRLILHGRAVCIARRPRCAVCVLNDFCPSAFLVGPGVVRAGAVSKRQRAPES
ncbi:MAG: endonuclease III domain-containing protein, partial [Acidimicrobiales bacterium]